MHKLMKYVCEELEDLERKVSKDSDLSMAELQYADTLAHLKKNLMKGEEVSGKDDYSKAMGRYSRRGSYADSSYDDGASYEDEESYYVRPDGSYARGRGAGARRDSMGRYSRSGDIKHNLHELMEKAGDEHTREELRRLIDRI